MFCGLEPLNLLSFGRPLDKVWKLNLYQGCCYWFLGCARIETRLDAKIKGTREALPGLPLEPKGDSALTERR